MTWDMISIIVSHEKFRMSRHDGGTQDSSLVPEAIRSSTSLDVCLVTSNLKPYQPKLLTL